MKQQLLRGATTFNRRCYSGLLNPLVHMDLSRSSLEDVSFRLSEADRTPIQLGVYRRL